MQEKRPRPWSKGEKELAQYHLTRGKTTAQVGQLLGRTKNSVVSHSYRVRGGESHPDRRTAGAGLPATPPPVKQVAAEPARPKGEPSPPRPLSRRELGLDNG